MTLGTFVSLGLTCFPLSLSQEFKGTSERGKGVLGGLEVWMGGPGPGFLMACDLPPVIFALECALASLL